jgi:SP family sugar:H+ symporter-like MFS transporter
VLNAKGQYELPTQRKSLMNSVPWIGKIVGCFLIEPLIDRVGYRSSIIVTSIVQIVSLIIEMTSHNWIQFTIGRNFAYLSVGLVWQTPSSSKQTCLKLIPACN